MSRFSARTGPAPPGRAGHRISCYSTPPPVSISVGATTSAGMSAGSWHRAPAACWCALTLRRRPPPPSPDPRAGRRHGAAHRGSGSRCHHLTSGDVGCRRSSSARTGVAGPATQPAPGPPEHSVEHRPVIGPPSAPLRGLVGQQGFQPSPLRVGQVMAIEHGLDLPYPAVMIHGTRSSRTSAVVCLRPGRGKPHRWKIGATPGPGSADGVPGSRSRDPHRRLPDD